MEAPKEFSIILSKSKKSADESPYQLSKFTCNLGATIKLNGRYQCALTHLHYPKSYYNLEKSFLRLGAFFPLSNAAKGYGSAVFRNYVIEHKKIIAPIIEKYFHVTLAEIIWQYRQSEGVLVCTFPGKELSDRTTRDIFIPDACYRDETELVLEINKALQKLEFKDTENKLEAAHVPNIYTVRHKGSLALKAGVVDNGFFFPIFSEEIQKLLGLSKYFEFDKTPELFVPKELIDRGKIYAYHDFKSNFNYVKVYSNFVKPSFVNNRMEPLLQIAAVPTIAPFGEQIAASFIPAHYIDVSVSEFNSIDVMLSFDGDEPIQLRSGEVILMLHIKKVE